MQLNRYGHQFASPDGRDGLIDVVHRFAGRSYNDLSQYPVMPWVLKSYTTPTIDLADPRNYRDFRYPMGAQTPERRERAAQQYESSFEMYKERDTSDAGSVMYQVLY